MLILPAPAAVQGDQLASEISSAGFGDVRVALSGTDLRVVAVGDADLPEGVAAVVASHVPDPAWTRTPQEATQRTVEQRLDAALDQLRAVVTATKPSTAAAQASAAYDASRLCARVLVGLVRLHLRRLDSAD